MKKAQSQTCAREEVHGATQGIPSWAHRLGPQALGATRTCLWRFSGWTCWNVAAIRAENEQVPGFLWRWHLFLIHFNYEHSQSVSQSVISRSRPALIRKYLVQLLISSHTIPAVGGAVSGARGTRASRPASRVSLINDRFGSKRGKGRAALSGTPHWSLRRGEAAETGERLLY